MERKEEEATKLFCCVIAKRQEKEFELSVRQMNLWNWRESPSVLFEILTLVKRAFVSEFMWLAAKSEIRCSERIYERQIRHVISAKRERGNYHINASLLK